MDVDIEIEKKIHVDHWKICAVKIELERACDAHEGYIEIWAVRCGIDDYGNEVMLSPKQVILSGEDYYRFMERQRLDVVSIVKELKCLGD